MTRMTPAKLVAENKNAPGGGVAAPASTEGVRPTTHAQEIVMTNHTPDRPWLDAHTAAILTDEDLAALDYSASMSIFDSRLERDDYMRAQAHDAARVRQFIGRDGIPMPDFVKLPNRNTTWDLTPERNDAVRYLDAEHVDAGKLNASLQVDQYALSGRVDTRVSISDCETSDPSELVNWALDLLALAERWKQIRKEQS